MRLELHVGDNCFPLKNLNSKKVEENKKTTTCGFKVFMESTRHYKDH